MKAMFYLECPNCAHKWKAHGKEENGCGTLDDDNKWNCPHCLSRRLPLEVCGDIIKIEQNGKIIDYKEI